MEEKVMDGKRLNKTHVKFWEGRLFHPKSLSAANAFPNWYVQMAHAGKQCQFTLGTPNKAEAARGAKEAYFLLKTNGWDAVWEKYGSKKKKTSPGTEGLTGTNCLEDMTFGEYIQVVEGKCSAKKETILECKQRLRVLLASMLGMNATNSKYDHFNKLNKRYEEEAFSAKIGEVTVGKVEEWKSKELKRRVGSGTKESSAATTINSIIHGCNGIFSGKILKELGLCGKFTSPFANTTRLKEGSKCYYSNFSARELLANAEKELKESHQDEFVIIVLALLQGLRANEIDKMIWNQIDLVGKTLSVMQTKYFTPKTMSSCKTIPLNDYAASVLLWHKESRDSKNDEFIIAPEVGFRKTEISRTKRCVKQMDEAIGWLRNFGIKDQKPIHTLRKECGSMIYRQTGDINATRLFLRDNTMAVVINHYADSTVVKVPKLDLQAGVLA